MRWGSAPLGVDVDVDEVEGPQGDREEGYEIAYPKALEPGIEQEVEADQGQDDADEVVDLELLPKEDEAHDRDGREGQGGDEGGP